MERVNSLTVSLVVTLGEIKLRFYSYQAHELWKLQTPNHEYYKGLGSYDDL